jgi:hypothetical protein
MSEWQPIETAPKDGTAILTVRHRYQPCVSSWQEHEGVARFGSEPEDFMEEDHFFQYWHETTYQPTHWMPLPQPPQE